MRVVALDTSGPMATNCGDVSVPRLRRKERPKALHFMSCGTRRRRALVLVAVGASQGWSASLLSLPALEHRLVGLGVLVNVDRQAESKVSLHAHVFDSMWAFQPVRFELVSRDCQPSPPLLFDRICIDVHVQVLRDRVVAKLAKLLSRWRIPVIQDGPEFCIL